MINNFRFYTSELLKMQSMKSFAVGKDTDIDELEHYQIILHYGTVLNCFSKELLVCLKTPVAFSTKMATSQ